MPRGRRIPNDNFVAPYPVNWIPAAKRFILVIPAKVDFAKTSFL